MRLSSLHISILKLMQVVYFSWLLHLPTCLQIYDIFRNEHRIKNTVYQKNKQDDDILYHHGLKEKNKTQESHRQK